MLKDGVADHHRERLLSSAFMAIYILLIIFSCTNLLFYFLGRLSGREKETIERFQTGLKQIKRDQTAIDPGPIDYVTPEKEKFYGSEEEKINEKAKELIQQNIQHFQPKL